jgi:hypothetical protein
LEESNTIDEQLLGETYELLKIQKAGYYESLSSNKKRSIVYALLFGIGALGFAIGILKGKIPLASGSFVLTTSGLFGLIEQIKSKSELNTHISLTEKSISLMENVISEVGKRK